MIKTSDFLFYNYDRRVSADWADTLDMLSAAGDDKEFALIQKKVSRRLVEFANEFMLQGNIWQHWLTYILMTHENPFSMACERISLNAGSTIYELALPDFALFRHLFDLDFDAEGLSSLKPFTHYVPPYDEYEAGFAGRHIISLSTSLSQSSDELEFAGILSGYYSTYGVGIYGMYRAFRVDEGGTELKIVPVTADVDVTFDQLVGYEEQKARLKENTEAFVSGAHANNVLLYGDSGTGKSTSVHALMHDYYDRGLRLVELSKQNRTMLPQVLSEIKKRNYKFIIFLDDLSFEENESDYKELKAMLEGALETRADRALIYATSNRRHLIRETWNDRNDMEYQNDIHHSDTMEEKLSLAARFGVTIYYSKPTPKEYLNIVRELTSRNGIEIDEEELDSIARKWELRHGGMTGRTASQLITWLQGRSVINDK